MFPFRRLNRPIHLSAEKSRTASAWEPEDPPMIRHCLASLAASALLSPLAPRGNRHPPPQGWHLQSACKITAAGDAISSPGFSTEGWISATVPTTVLAAQVAAGLLPDPYFGDNLRKIPGTDLSHRHNFSNLPMPADSPYHCGWWYRDEFTVPAAAARSSQFWLHFAGINYRADIWLNGHRIADSSQIAGAYRIYNLDVTGVLKPAGHNVLAVETFAPTADRSRHQLGRLESRPARQGHGPDRRRQSRLYRRRRAPLPHGRHSFP